MNETRTVTARPIVTARPMTLPVAAPARSSRRHAALLVLASVLGVLMIAGAGALFYSTGVAELHVQVGQAISAVADLKVGELERYRAERMADGNELRGNAAFALLIGRLTRDPTDADASREIRAWLDGLVPSQGVEYVHVLDATGRTLLSVPPVASPLASTIARRVGEVLQSRQVAFQDFFLSDQDGRVHMAVLVPIADARPDGPPIGLIELGIDPTTYLDPFLQAWPLPSGTGETYLVRRDGSDVLYLNSLRFNPEAALSVRVPLSATDTPAVQAVLGTTGVVEGHDYRHTAVYAALRSVPGTPWFLVAKLDASEADAPLQGRLWLTLLLIAALLVSVLGGIVGLWRWQAPRRAREGVEAERAQAWLHEVIARSLNEVYVVDPETLLIRFANRGACRNVGYTQEELTARTPLDLLPLLTEEDLRTRLASLRGRDRPVVQFDTVHRRKDGTEYPVEVHLQLVDTGNGVVALAIVDDITERRGLEAEREHLLVAIEQSTDAVLVLDPDTAIRYANRAVLAMSGYSREELYGEKAEIFAGSDGAEENPDGWRAITARGWSGTLPAHGKDGRVFEAEWTTTPMRDGSGALAGFVAIARNRSRERALETQLARTQKLEAIGQLGAGIAHDFNNILTTAGGYAQLLREQVSAGDPMREDLDQIVAATERGAALVRQILAFSRRQVLEPGLVDLNGLVEGLATMLGRLVGEQVELRLVLEPHLGYLKADPGQIQRVIVNLAQNARDAMPDGGRLSIETANVEPDGADPGSHEGLRPGPQVLLTVRDSGVGMDRATLEHMFEPFFTTKGPDKGTGLGLAAVHGIVSQSGGLVLAHSEPGRGTTFSIYFPREVRDPLEAAVA